MPSNDFLHSTAYQKARKTNYMHSIRLFGPSDANTGQAGPAQKGYNYNFGDVYQQKSHRLQLPNTELLSRITE